MGLLSQGLIGGTPINDNCMNTKFGKPANLPLITIPAQ